MLTNQDGIRERIIQIRKERGLSQNQLAKDFGISRTHYCNVENGKKPVTESFLKVLASGYKIPMEAFIPNENGDLMQYCECTNDFVNAIIDDYFNSFKIRKDLTEGLVYEWTNSMEQIHDRYSDEEIKTLWSKLYEINNVDSILIMIYTGLRPTELLEI